MNYLRTVNILAVKINSAMSILIDLDLVPIFK
jgi:hypothetical protein